MSCKARISSLQRNCISLLFCIALLALPINLRAELGLSVDVSPSLNQKLATGERPKIGVVLAGGGAKGIAHVSVLETLEEAGIPIDYIVGTSMGSIVGGLYAAGYSPAMMREIIRNTDWINLIADNPDFGTGQLSSKENMQTYLLRFNLERAQKLSTGWGGVLEGANVLKLLRNLTSHIPDSLSFDQLPIPFACVGTDIVTGEPKVLDHGNLPLAIRTSMAIPSVFTPVMLDGRAYVDGGVVNNYPVDVARQMGADIVIGSNLVTRITYTELTNNGLNILLHIFDLIGKKRNDLNIEDTDIYIATDVTGYSAASFGASAIDTLLQRGHLAAIKQQPKLDSLCHELNLTETPHRIRLGEFSYDSLFHLKLTPPQQVKHDQRDLKNIMHQLSHLFKSRHHLAKRAIGLGIRFDSREYVAMLMGADFVLEKSRNVKLGLKARLGNRIELSTDMSMRTWHTLRLGLNYTFQYDETPVYAGGEKIVNYDSYSNKLNLYLEQEWNDFRWRCGMKADFCSQTNPLLKNNYGEVNDIYESYFAPYIQLDFNTLDRYYYPTRGTRIRAEIDYLSNIRFTHYGEWTEGSSCGELSLLWQSAWTVANRLTFMPHIKTNLFTRPISPLWSTHTMLGSYGDMLHHNVQYSMAGYVSEELINRSVGILGCELQQRLFRYQYLSLGFDYLTQFCINNTTSDLDPFNSSLSHVGVKAAYGLRSFFGPISLEWHWNDDSRKSYVFLNMGYYF